MSFLKLPEKRDKSKRLNALQVWTRRFLDKNYMHNSIKGVSREYNFYTNGMSTFSGRNSITTYYTFDAFPNELPLAYIDEFQRLAKSSVKISAIEYLEPTIIEWDSPAIRNKLSAWKKVASDIDDVDEYNFRENLKFLDNNVWRRQSLIYLSGAEIRRKRKLFKYRVMLVVSGNRGLDYDEVLIACEAQAKRMGIQMTRVTSDMSTFLRAFSPLSAEMTSKVSKLVGNTVLTDEVISRFGSYDQGKIGERGIYVGTDIYSGYPVLKMIKPNTEAAENILITAVTGYGKSFLWKGWLIQIVGDDRFTGTIMDIEGFEYLPMADFLKANDNVVVLNMAEGKGLYYDPVEITVTGVKKLDKDMLNLSSSFTTALLKVLVGDFQNVPEKNKWISDIISDSVAKTYANAGVTQDPITWHKSKGLSLKSVYETFLGVYQKAITYKYAVERGEVTPDASQNYRINVNYVDAMDTIASSLRKYFESFENGGTNAHVFESKISLNDIIDARLVVCSFGLAGKSEAKIDPVQLALSQSYAAIISQVRSLFAKARGKYNFKVWEEFQRWGRMEGSEAILNSALTGGRKLGDVNIVITNKVSEMLGQKDKFGIFENTTSFAIGGIDDANVREALCKALSVEYLRSELDKLVAIDKRTEGNVTTVGSIYDKGFLVKLDKSVVSLVRMDIPESLAKSDLFRTGIDEVSE